LYPGQKFSRIALIETIDLQGILNLLALINIGKLALQVGGQPIYIKICLIGFMGERPHDSPLGGFH
jgi:hypothetical protein